MNKVDSAMFKLLLGSFGFLVTFLYISTGATAISHILLLVPMCYFTYRAVKEGEFSLSGSQLSLLGFLFFAIISIIFAESHPGSLKALKKLKYGLIAVLAVFPYFYFCRDFSSKKQIKILFWILIIFASIASISGIIGVHTGFNPIRFKAAVSHERSSGAYGNIMTYGYGMQALVLLLLGCVLYIEDFKNLVSRKILVIVFIINLVGMYYSGCRGAILGFLCALSFILYKKCKKVSIVIALCGALGVGAIVTTMLTGGSTSSRILQKVNSESNVTRIGQYQAAVYAFLENPWTGIGYRNFEPNSVELKKKYDLPYPDFRGHAHSNFFEALGATGVGGLISLILFHFFWFRETWMRNDFIGKVFPAIVVSLFVSGQFENTMSDGEIMYGLMALYSISVATMKRSKKEKTA